jgi:predicted PilT family ATPase
MLIGREGKTIRMLEESLGISLEVKEHERESRGPDKPRGREIPFGVGGNNRRIEFTFDSSLTGEDVDVYVDGAFIASMEVGKKGISIQRENKLGRLLMRAVDGGQKVQFFAKA